MYFIIDQSFRFEHRGMSSSHGAVWFTPTLVGLVHDQHLAEGDKQFLLAIESWDVLLRLYFIDAGGYSKFTGLSGYLV